MAKYKPLKFMELLEIIYSNNDKTLEMEKLKDNIENNYNDILEYIKLTGKGGELNIKFKIYQEKLGKVIIDTNVSKKLKKIKNQIELTQNEEGKVFLDNPEQEVLPGVLQVGISE